MLDQCLHALLKTTIQSTHCISLPPNPAELMSYAVEVESPNPWTAREFLLGTAVLLVVFNRYPWNTGQTLCQASQERA